MCTDVRRDTGPQATKNHFLKRRLTPDHGARNLGPFGIMVLLTGVFMPQADYFIVNVALPTIDQSLHASSGALELIVAGYGTVYAALLVVGGRLGDIVGRRRVFAIGLASFTTASLACGMAPDVWFLLGARLWQGASAALIVPQVLATFHATLQGPKLHRAQSLYGAAAGLAIAVGQLAGGLLVTINIAGTTWRPIFWVNVPIGLATLIAVPRVVPATRSKHPATIDTGGTLLFTATRSPSERVDQGLGDILGGGGATHVTGQDAGCGGGFDGRIPHRRRQARCGVPRRMPDAFPTTP